MDFSSSELELEDEEGERLRLLLRGSFFSTSDAELEDEELEEESEELLSESLLDSSLSSFLFFFDFDFFILTNLIKMISCSNYFNKKNPRKYTFSIGRQ